jgi:hypothetical protein
LGQIEPQTQRQAITPNCSLGADADLGLEHAVGRLGQRGVMAVTDAADIRFDACFGQPLGLFD